MITKNFACKIPIPLWMMFFWKLWMCDSPDTVMIWRSFSHVMPQLLRMKGFLKKNLKLFKNAMEGDKRHPIKEKDQADLKFNKEKTWFSAIFRNFLHFYSPEDELKNRRLKSQAELNSKENRHMNKMLIKFLLERSLVEFVVNLFCATKLSIASKVQCNCQSNATKLKS